MTKLNLLLCRCLSAVLVLTLSCAYAQTSGQQKNAATDYFNQTNGVNGANTGNAGAGLVSPNVPNYMGSVGKEPNVAPQDNSSPQNVDELNRVLSRARGVARKEPPSQFQKFVQEATGKLLPSFGSQLFEAPQNYVPDAGLAAPSSYVIGAGDEIRMQVWGAVDFSSSLVVDRNGQVLIPKVGTVTLAGVKVGDLEAVLKGQVAKVFANFGLSATLGKLRSVQVYVVGQARQPGTYAVSSLSTLVNVLFVSGGPSVNGSMRGIELRRAGKLITRLDLYDFIAKGDKSHDAALLPGDVIFIPPVGSLVAVTGAYDQAAIYELKDGNTTLEEILNIGGGASPMATTRKALLERVYPEKIPARQVLDLALDAKGLKQVLKGGDILTLLPISPAFSNAVTLQGVVAEPVRYRWFEGMRILDLIPDREALITTDYYKRKNALVQNVRDRDTDATMSDLGVYDRSGANINNNRREMRNGTRNAPTANDNNGANANSVDNGSQRINLAKEASADIAERFRRMVDQINWEYAVIERLNRDTLTTELVPFNLGRAIIEKDASQNLLLQPGDVVTIVSQTDLALPQERQNRLVRIEGEVAAPGIYQANAGETLSQLIQRIGGLTPQAYLFGMEVKRESVRKSQQENLDALIRRLEAQSQSQANAVLASQTSQSAVQTQVLQQQQAQQIRSQIERLKTLRSNGRLALELDPQVSSLAELPALPLEDGDRIMIPARPGFVAAYGSVYNDNVFIYKPGKTVADVLKTAGLSDEADIDQAFVLRADGSVVARRDHGSWFSRDFEAMLLMPGDSVVVPAQTDRRSGYAKFIEGAKDWTAIFYQFGLGAAAVKTFQ